MKSFLKRIWEKEAFDPSYLLGIWINPVFIIRKGLIEGIRDISSYMHGGNLLAIALNKVLPKSKNFYHNNIVLAKNYKL